ncbi:hypothetical protein ACJMK2_041402 [Sinanodonta woodiana]|uniref:NACHT domain-containing protein n=1 Tax=Sinanodonta woodiana TaxID=1069815 RepID=A0ABD3W5C9_SINWO
MIKLFSLRCYAVCVIFKHLFLQKMTSLALGSFESVSAATCEYKDAKLEWRNIPPYSVNDVKAISWYKGKDTRIATWLDGKGFKEDSPYNGRLTQIGETDLWLRAATRSDNGSYSFTLTFATTHRTLDAVTHLEVIAAPSSQCKPNITEEGSILKAEVPSVGCGTPPLSPKWKNTSNTLIQEAQNPSLLDLGGDFKAGKFIVCAEGNSAICYQGNISDLCAVITKSHHGQRDDGWTPNPVSIILPIALIVSILAVIWWKRKLFCGNRQCEQICLTPEDTPTDIAIGCGLNEEIPLIEIGETSREGLPEIQSYLRGLYKDMTRVSLSSTGKENFTDVSEVYIDLDFQQMETRDLKHSETNLSWKTSYKLSASNDDIGIVGARNQPVSPIIIIGCRGSGKSTWCKHLVDCWSEISKHDNANVQDINLPNLGEYQILLYLPLKSSDRGLSFQELLQHYLFQEKPEYLNVVTKHIRDRSRAQSVLIRIDGFETIGENVQSMSELLDHNLLFSSTVIFTCRPSCLNRIVNTYTDISIQLDLFKVCEIPLERSAAYASKVLRRFNQQNKESNINNFLTFTRNLHVQSLLQLPYLCLLLLFVWMENRKPFIEITDILLRIVEHILDSEETVMQCNAKINTLSQRNVPNVHRHVTKLDDRFVYIRNLMYQLSMTTEQIFLSESTILTHKVRPFQDDPAIERDTLPFEVLHDIGLIIEHVPLKSDVSISTVNFTNMLIYQLFVSMAIAFKKGLVFKYLVSDPEVALKHSMIIHMLWQFSPKLGKKIFVELRKFKIHKFKQLGFGEHSNTCRCRYSIRYISNEETYQLTWLKLLLYKGDLDDDKLLLLTNALRSRVSLTTLVLENNENNDDLVFWLPCSESLEKLTLNINKCTLLVCSEWNNQIPIQLRKVVIKSVNISSRDHEVLCRAIHSCPKIENLEMSPTVVSAGDFS